MVFLGIVFCRPKDIDTHIVFIRSTTFFSVNEDFCVIVSHFVDPRTGEHTNGIENCWSLMKKNLRRFYPIKNNEWFLLYFYSYQFRFNFLNHHRKMEMFVKIMELVA